MIPFNLEQALQGKPFGNGQGNEGESIHVLPEKYRTFDSSIIALFKDGTVRHYDLSGRSTCKHESDLQMLPEEKVWYVNEYEDRFGHYVKSYEESIRYADKECIGVLRITRHHNGDYSIEKVK